MYYCDPCDRWFNTCNSYDQHIDNAAAHRAYDDPEYECDYCDRSFHSEYARDQHHEKAAGHPYCIPCKRMFQNENNLRMHQHGSAHMGGSIDCPFCKRAFTTASGVVVHLESKACTSSLNRQKINAEIQRLDRNNVITRPMLTMPGYDRVQTIATERSWNGYSYECYLCSREFSQLNGLNNHLKSPAHEQNLYRCPKASCGREYKLLSGLVQHVESESCGVMRFAQVQKTARNGIQNMVGRMIQV